jgi:hypothetical protein
LAAAVTVAVWSKVMAATLAVNADEAAPAGTFTEEGTVTLALFFEIVTAKPPEGACPLSATVQLAEPGALIVPGEQVNALSCSAAMRLTSSVRLSPFQVAVTVAFWLPETAPTVAVNVPLADPAAITRLDGTGSAARLLVNVTVAVLAADFDSVTVQVTVCPLLAELGVQVSPDS